MHPLGKMNHLGKLTFLLSLLNVFLKKTTDAAHGFTSWGTGPMSAYNEMADSRSWWSMMSLFKTLTIPTEPEHVEVVSDEEHADVSSDEEDSTDASSDVEDSTDASSDEEHSTDASSGGEDESSASTGATGLAFFVSLATASLVATIAS